MKLTLTEIIEALDSKADLDSLALSVEEEVLAGSFVHERTERPEMLRVVVEHESLLIRYLGLPAQQRAHLEGLRAKRPEYLEGDYETEAPIRLNIKPSEFIEQTFELYKDTHTTKAITQITTHYTNNPPTNTKGPVSPKAYFLSYDPHTGNNLKPKKEGKTTTGHTPPGQKYYDQWHTQQQKHPNTPDFDTWIQQQLPPDLQERLLRTQYYQQPRQPDLSIQQIVQHYTNNPPTNTQGPVSPKAYFQRYDPQTGNNLKPKKDGKTTTHNTPPGDKYHAQWHRQHKKDPSTPDFDTWIQQQLPPELREKMLQTPYFTQTNLTINQIVEHYTNNPPTNTQGPVSPKAYFQSYDPQTGNHLKPTKHGKKTTHNTPPGNKYYTQWYAQHEKQPSTPDFDTWIQQQLPTDLRERLLQTPYFTQTNLTIQQIITHYTNNPPTSRKGPVSPKAYFLSYNPHTGNHLRPTKHGKTTTHNTSPGNKYYQQWYAQHNKQPNTPNFDDWVIAQIPDGLKSELLQTPYFLNKTAKGELS